MRHKAPKRHVLTKNKTMKRINYCTYILSDGSIANVYSNETHVYLNRKFWNTGKLVLGMPRKSALAVLQEMTQILVNNHPHNTQSHETI